MLAAPRERDEVPASVSNGKAVLKNVHDSDDCGQQCDSYAY
jgi:hypothetical protein